MIFLFFQGPTASAQAPEGRPAVAGKQRRHGVHLGRRRHRLEEAVRDVDRRRRRPRRQDLHLGQRRQPAQRRHVRQDLDVNVNGDVYVDVDPAERCRHFDDVRSNDGHRSFDAASVKILSQKCFRYFSKSNKNNIKDRF